ncbi:MAG: sugar ABC transporter permease [Bifidobacteriaceae bacterium]|jgi:raffinose/stachyose/melibiose transport system permease protein|nr:sugar ABC transporter permease [Bifidobacteriaceae bacterium]
MAAKPPASAKAPRGRVPSGARRRGAGRRRWVGLAYAAPALALFAFIVLVPLGQSVRYSLYKWDGISAGKWAGAKNYIAFFTDPLLRDSLVHVLVLVVFFALIPTFLGLVTAGLLGHGRIHGAAFHRTVIFLPQVLAMVVVAVVWRRLLGPDGPINTALKAAGLDSLALNWLGDFTWALPAVGMVGFWINLGLCAVLYLATVGSIPTERYEAARVDGAGPFRVFLAVTVPAMRGPTAVALTLTITGALRTFDLVWNMTKGGPGNATTTPAVMLFRYAFRNPQVGQAAAIGVIMAVFCLLVALALVKLTERDK